LSDIHFVSKTNISTEDTSSISILILNDLREAMDDVNRLNSSILKTESLIKSNNMSISTMGLVLNSSMKQLVDTHDTWIKYLRGVDEYNLEFSEYQYQFASLHSDTKTIYISLLENASLFPYVVFELDEEDEDVYIDEEIKDYFVEKVDQYFKDYFLENDLFYKTTGNRYAVIILVEGYIDFLTGE